MHTLHLITLLLTKTKAFLGVILLATSLYGQTDFFTTVTNLWYQGEKAQVLQMAEQRLAVHENDIAGLIIKMEYAIEFNQLGQISNAVKRVLAVGPRVRTPMFRKNFPDLKTELNETLLFLKEYRPTAEELLEDSTKGNINEKPMQFEADLKALQDDGFFNP